MNLQGIFVYPIKSCAGISVKEAVVTPRGLTMDRRWMVVDEHGKFITARTEHRMVLIETAFEEENIVARSGTAELRIPTDLPDGPKRTVHIWRNHVDALIHEEGSRWFSEALKRQVNLVYMPDTTHRPVNLKYGTEEDKVSFADGYPVLVIGQASLDDLNQRLESPVTMTRFRPNLVVAGTDAFAEDEWRTATIGSASFRAVKPCDRCSLTTVDPKTGTPGREPLKTLAAFRTIVHDGERKVLFGMNLIPNGSGSLKVGSPVQPVARD